MNQTVLPIQILRCVYSSRLSLYHLYLSCSVKLQTLKGKCRNRRSYCKKRSWWLEVLTGLWLMHIYCVCILFSLLSLVEYHTGDSSQENETGTENRRYVCTLCMNLCICSVNNLSLYWREFINYFNVNMIYPIAKPQLTPWM